MSPNRARPRRALTPAFTLIELLVVVALIALLIGILLPSLAGARDTARIARCLGQMRTLGQLTTFYADDNAEHMPRSMHSAMGNRALPWGYAFFQDVAGVPYTGNDTAWRTVFNGLYRCPMDMRSERWSYGYNVYYELDDDETRGRTWRRIGLIPRPAATVVFAELGDTTTADHAMAHFWSQFHAPPEVDAARHGPTTGAAFADGHAQTLPFGDLFDADAGVDRFNPLTAQTGRTSRTIRNLP